jgi:leucyl-tRNA synthetase
VPKKEYAKKLINQGMIQGVIEFLKLQKDKVDGYSRFVCADIAKEEEAKGVEFAQIPIHIDYVQEYGSNASHIDMDSIKKFVDWRPEYNNAIFECGSGIYHNGVFTPKGDATGSHLMTVSEVGKMSKRYFNVVNPDDVVDRYGADCFRMYEMFLGPLEQAKPWNTSSINGVSRFLNSFWRLFYDKDDWTVNDEAPNKDEMKVLHAAIKKVTEDIERFSFNTGVSAFMVATNELGRLKCNKRAILEPLLILMAPYAVHLCEELWEKMGNTESIHHATWPTLEEKWLIEENVTYPIAINGKTRATVDFPADATKAELEAAAPDIADIQRHLEGKTIRKIIVVPGRMINIVVG